MIEANGNESCGYWRFLMEPGKMPQLSQVADVQQLEKNRVCRSRPIALHIQSFPALV